MKTSSKQLVMIAGLLMVLTIIAIAAAKHDKTGKVTFRDSMTVIIHPGTNISKPDEKALNDVLKHYDKSVYRIETYQKGKRKKTKGQLIDMYIDKATAAEVSRFRIGWSFDQDDSVHRAHLTFLGKYGQAGSRCLPYFGKHFREERCPRG